MRHRWQMKCNDLPAALAARLVGDPIDAVTGELFDSVQDFRVAASAMPVTWNRTYSTTRIDEDRGLGRGHSHSFDHRLTLDLDGVRYTSPLGTTIVFPGFHGGEERVARNGYILHREGARLRLLRPADDDLVFELGRSPHARLVEVSRREASIHVRYERDGRLASLVDVGGNVVSFNWEARHIVSARVLSRGGQSVQLVRYRYENDLLVEMEDAYKGRVHLAYDEAGRLIKRTDRNDYSFHFQYDADGRCTHSAGDDGVLEVTLEYVPLEYFTRVTKSDGGVWEYHYDASKTLTKIIAPDGVTRTFIPRPLDGQVATEIDGAGNEIIYLYNGDGRCVGRRDSLDRPILAPRSHQRPGAPFEYELGRFAVLPDELPTLALVQNSLPPAATAALVLADGPGAGKIREVRDIQGLLIRQECDGRSRRYAYDKGGNLRWKIDLDGAKTEWVHASDDHRVSKTDPNGFVTLLEYTKESMLAAVVDAHHTRTTFSRDKQSRIAGVSRADAWKEGYRRDGAGRLIGKTDARGASLFEVKRGPQGEVLERTFASGGFERFVYDNRLRIVEAHTPNGGQSFAYDSDHRRTADMRDEKGVQRYFAGSDLVEYRVLDAFVTRYRYLETPESREVVITDPTGRAHRLRDYRFGVVMRELASGRRETAQYHPAGHCLGKTVDSPSGSAPSWSRRYEYSGEGYLLAKHDSVAGSTRYALDAAHRLVGEVLPNGQERQYAHDAAGNLLQHAGRVATYHPGNVIAAAGPRRYEHDARHAVCTEAWQGGFRRFHRDERDQLVRVEAFRATPAGAWERRAEWTARYDALNRRIEKASGDQKTVFYWDSDRLAAEILPGGALRVYVYADALAMTPMLFVDYASVNASAASGVVYAVFADQLGCPERIEDMSGKTVWSAVIAPYGAALVTSGAEFHQPLRWPGHYYDAELGLQYNRFRTYSPELGRYLEPDPLGRGGGLDNIYAYTNNPLFRVDLDGLCGDENDDENKTVEPTDPADKPMEEDDAAGQKTPKEDDGMALSRDEAEAKARAVDKAYRESLAKKIADGEMSNRDAGPVTATVVDRKTGKAFSGHNDRNGEPPENMHPVVQDMVNESKANQQHPSDPGSHAEVSALNQAVNARQADNDAQGLGPVTKSDLGDFTQVSTWRKGSGNGRMKPGDDAPRCGNCQTCTNGVDNRSGDAPPKPPPYDD